MEKTVRDAGVLPNKMGGGPHGLGDPEDRSLRKVEMEVMIPKKMQYRAKTEKCIPENEAFRTCCKDAGLSMVLKCRKENSALQECLLKWYANEGFKEECKEEYLRERSEYRRTGIKVKSQYK